MPTVTIANGASTSDDFTLTPSNSPLGVVIPSGLTGTGLTMEATFDNGATYHVVQVVGGGSAMPMTKQASGNGYVPCDPRCVKGVRRGRLVSSTNEGAARTIWVVEDRLE